MDPESYPCLWEAPGPPTWGRTWRTWRPAAGRSLRRTDIERQKLEHVYCFKERTIKWKLCLCPLTSTFHLWVIHNDPSAKTSGLTCVVGRIVVGVQKLLDIQGAGEQGMLGNWVQIGLQPPLPLCDELPVHVSNELLGWKRESDATHLQGRRGRESWWYTLYVCLLYYH